MAAEKRFQVLQDRIECVTEDCVTANSALHPLKKKKTKEYAIYD